MKLTKQGCRARQKRLIEIVAGKGLAGAIIGQREHVYYLSGHLHNMYHSAALFLSTDGVAVLAGDGDVEDPLETFAIDEYRPYATHRMYTMHTRQSEEASKAIAAVLPRDVACDVGGSSILFSLGQEPSADVTPDILAMRRKKDPDEVDAIRHSIRLTDVMYETAKKIIEPGADEIEVYSEIQAATTRSAGEFLEAFGNDFRANAMAGPPRHRPMNAGELYVLDAGPKIHGYHADNCRTFSVDSMPTAEQNKVWERIDSLFPILEGLARPGLAASDLFDVANEHLSWEGYGGLVHHLGHAIGLKPHESPELNPEYDAVLEVGNVITMEPGLYGDKLSGGIRLEENYLVVESGLDKLTSFPRSLA